MEEDKGQISNFNEASLKMERIHELQRMLNRLRVNLLAVDIETGQNNYQIFIQCLHSLYSEVRSKCSDKEKKQGNGWRDGIANMIEFVPIIKTYWKETREGKQLMSRVDNPSWIKLRDYLFNFEDFIRDMLEEHGMSAPNQEMEALWD